MHYSLIYTRYELFWLFLVYSFLGWTITVLISSIHRRRFINPGVLNLPLCPMYGFCGVLYSIFLTELGTHFVFIFLGGLVLSSFVVVVTGMLLARIFHKEWWAYTRFSFGERGFITLPLTVIYGFCAILVLKVGNPLFLRLLGLLPRGLGNILLIASCVLVALDLCSALATVWSWKRYINSLSGLTGNMQRFSSAYGNVLTRTVRRRLEHSYPNLKTEELVRKKEETSTKADRVFAEGNSFFKLFWLFLIGSFVGDIVETIFCRITLGWWMSRSSLIYGPFSVIWGFACSMLTMLLYRHRNKSDRRLFIYGTIVGGTYEYVCSIGAELIFGASFWNYSHIPFNLGGRINLLFCFFWGIVAVIWVNEVYPFLSRLIEKIPVKAGTVITWVLVVLMSVDMLLSGAALIRYSYRQLGHEPANVIEEFLDDNYDDELMARVYPKAKIVRED